MQQMKLLEFNSFEFDAGDTLGSISTTQKVSHQLGC
jgi:hypothetical protein